MSLKNWKDKELLLLIEDGLNLSLDAMAAEGAGRTKQNIVANGQVDTGFMLNSVYSAGPGGSDFSGGDKSAPAQLAGVKEALFGASAEYALINEIKKPFVYPAVESLAADVPGIMKKVIKL